LPSSCWCWPICSICSIARSLDRSIVSILAQSIKADLKLDDADLGFLLGTAFAVFYSIVGIAMGRISDFDSRKKMMAFGLALWSIMTAMGGAAIGFATLSAARIGVGVGETAAVRDRRKAPCPCGGCGREIINYRSGCRGDEGGCRRTVPSPTKASVVVLVVRRNAQDCPGFKQR
jgi:MFS family permease